MIKLTKGSLIVHVYVGSVALPVDKATVHILGENTDITLMTDRFGRTEIVELDAPDVMYSLEPQNEVRPYAVYDVRVHKEGYVDTVMHNVEVFAGQKSIQNVFLVSLDETDQDVIVIDIAPPALWDVPKAYVPDEAALQANPFVLPFVLIPDYVIVHNGAPTNTAAARYYVQFIDYITNVACSEIYSTWPVQTIKANVHAIVSFTLNRVFTEWYVARGFNFTITALPAYDQKFTPGRTIFASIADVVNNYFDQYIRIGSQTHPFLAQYNDGIVTNNPGWLSQWGSKELGDRGYTAIQILRYFYGPQANLFTAPLSSTNPSSFPGYTLQLGSCGQPVQLMQNRLNIIRGNYPGIPVIPNANGVFNETTRNTIRVFQDVFNLPVTGVVDFATWYRISYMYIATGNLLRMAYS